MTIKVLYSKDFLRIYKKFDRNLQQEVKEKVDLFKHSEHHERLHVHKLKGKLKGLQSFSVTHKIRIIFSFVEAHTALLTSIGSHDEVY